MAKDISYQAEEKKLAQEIRITIGKLNMLIESAKKLNMKVNISVDDSEYTNGEYVVEDINRTDSF